MRHLRGTSVERSERRRANGDPSKQPRSQLQRQSNPAAQPFSRAQPRPVPVTSLQRNGHSSRSSQPSNRNSRLKACLQELCKQSTLLKDQVVDYESLGSLAKSECDPAELTNLLSAYQSEYQSVLPSLHERTETILRRISQLKVELGQYQSYQENVQSNFDIIGKKLPTIARRYNKDNWRYWSSERLVQWICSIDGGYFEPRAEELAGHVAGQGVKGEHLKSLDINALLGLGIQKFEDRLKLVTAITELTSVEPDHTKHVETPNEFKCPITMEIMRDPVICADGHTYERAALIRWFQNHDTSPKTGAVVESKTLIRNYGLRALITDFLNKYSDHG